jgi:hypothetical protein
MIPRILLLEKGRINIGYCPNYDFQDVRIIGLGEAGIAV